MATTSNLSTGIDTLNGGTGYDSITSSYRLPPGIPSSSIDTTPPNMFFAAPTGSTDPWIINGYGGNDTLHGGWGDDVLEGGLGADDLNGGYGIDTASYAHAARGVTIDLNMGAQSGLGEENGDGLWGIENVTGSEFDDVLQGADGSTTDSTGNGVDNLFLGGGGNDRLAGRGGNDTLEGGVGADDLNGGYGIDTASYAHAARGVTIDLNMGAQSGSGEENGDGLWGIENVTGSQFNDVLRGADGATTNSTGNGPDNVLMGLDGNDLLDGRAGNDTLDGGQGDDTLIGGAGNDMLIGGAGTDTAVFSGSYADYGVAYDGTFLLAPNGAVTHVSNIEYFQFADVTVSAAVLAQGVAALRPTVTASGSPVIISAQTDILACSVAQPVPR